MILTVLVVRGRALSLLVKVGRGESVKVRNSVVESHFLTLSLSHLLHLEGDYLPKFRPMRASFFVVSMGVFCRKDVHFGVI